MDSDRRNVIPWPTMLRHGSDPMLNILNISIDGDLLLNKPDNETQARQSIYAGKLPARMIYLVKARMADGQHPIDFEDEMIRAIPCRVFHWALFPLMAALTGIRVMADRQIEIVQVQEPFLCGPAGVYLSNRFKVPLVVGMFNDDVDNPHWLAESLLNRIANPVGKWVLKHASVIRTDSRQMADRLKRMGYPFVVYIPFLLTDARQFYSPSADAVEWRGKLLGKNDGPLILIVARLEWQKNISMLIEAFASVRCRVPGAVLAVAGDGALRCELEAKAKVLAPGAVNFLGRVAYAELPALFQAADLSVLPSHHETSARVLSLSLLSGTPVLSTDTTGAREVIEEGLTGRIVPVGDLDAFTTALYDMCMDSEGRKKMGLRARERLIKEVSAESVVSALRDMYQKVSKRKL